MADYYSIRARAVSALDLSTADTRGQLYDRARSAMILKLLAAMPPFDGADVAVANIAFETAVARVEAEAIERDVATAASVGAPPLSPARQGTHQLAESLTLGDSQISGTVIQEGNRRGRNAA
jgi:hypothetical protein